VSVISVRLYTKLGFVDNFSDNPQIQNVTKILPVEVALLHADRHNVANIRFSYRFVNEPKHFLSNASAYRPHCNSVTRGSAALLCIHLHNFTKNIGQNIRKERTVDI
jgi:hypothetical protein